jgi:GNAT superfamily N-acetyltransferase
VIPVLIRKARCDDAGFLAWAILAASRGHLARGWFDVALNQSEGRCLDFLRQLTIASTLSLWHYSRFIVAEADASPVAALCAFRAADAYAISPAAITETIETLGLPISERALIWERGAYAFTCTTPPNRDSLVIENIATLPNHRRRGYTAALLAQAIEAGRAGGLAEAQITFLIGNESAERVYERAGFHLADEWRHPEFEAITQSAGLRRFVRNL